MWEREWRDSLSQTNYASAGWMQIQTEKLPSRAANRKSANRMVLGCWRSQKNKIMANGVPRPKKKRNKSTTNPGTTRERITDLEIQKARFWWVFHENEQKANPGTTREQPGNELPIWKFKGNQTREQPYFSGINKIRNKSTTNPGLGWAV